VKVFDDDGFPVGEELGFQVVLAAEYGLTDVAANELQNELGFELGGECPASARHDDSLVWCPVPVRLLVQIQGRSARTSKAPPIASNAARPANNVCST
jgi:hypothetical protein